MPHNMPPPRMSYNVTVLPFTDYAAVISNATVTDVLTGCGNSDFQKCGWYVLHSTCAHERHAAALYSDVSFFPDTGVSQLLMHGQGTDLVRQVWLSYDVSYGSTAAVVHFTTCCCTFVCSTLAWSLYRAGVDFKCRFALNWVDLTAGQTLQGCECTIWSGQLYKWTVNKLVVDCPCAGPWTANATLPQTKMYSTSDIVSRLP